MMPCRIHLLAFILAVLPCADWLRAQDSAIDGKDLYRQLCSACHGKSGLADGRAARFVFPPPRNLRHAPFRLVSSVNLVPSQEDIHRVIEEGVPGTAMQQWRELGDAKINALVTTVIELRVAGARERYQQLILETNGANATINDKEQDAYVERVTTAGDKWRSDSLQSINDSVLQRGAEVYVHQKCNSCHGDHGRGSRGMDLVDLSGRPTWAVDLRRDHFHGGHLPADVARRIYLGMPGSAMPSSTNLSPDDLQALVAYSLSLAEKSRFDLTNHQRRERAIGRLRPPQTPKSP